ncbi:MAG: class I SAM-dependent methyltransferase [Terriglobia bacterium]
MEIKKHWDSIYSTKESTQVSWYQEHPVLSLHLIEHTGVDKEHQIIDVGGGTSTLVDDLLASGFNHITVLDISATALAMARQRLGIQADKVSWIEADITKASLPHQFFDLWHDRAVFHFLREPEERHRYIQAVQHSVKTGGHVIVATFATDGPARCSGLDIVRYSPESLHSEFGDDFRLVESTRETHTTPFGVEQKFIYCYCRKCSSVV